MRTLDDIIGFMHSGSYTEADVRDAWHDGRASMAKLAREETERGDAVHAALASEQAEIECLSAELLSAREALRQISDFCSMPVTVTQMLATPKQVRTAVEDLLAHVGAMATAALSPSPKGTPPGTPGEGR